jgi:predicted ATPase
MHITKFELENVRCFEHLEWEIEESRGPGWHVILGDNGTGKTTLLKALCAVLLSSGINSLTLSLNKLLTHGADDANIKLDIISKKQPRNYELIIHDTGSYTSVIPLYPEDFILIAFGSFRRSSGGDSRYDEILKDAKSPDAACLTLFVESAALREAPRWLCHLRAKSFENRALRPEQQDREGALLEQIIAFINQPAGDVAFLANGARLDEVSVDEVYFVDGHGARIRIWDLSEGYQSVLSIVLETLRLMAARAGDAPIIAMREDGRHIVDVEGVILIDEVDAHLHPDWQTKIGRWFVQSFPKVQFIVTTHSPLICQAVALGGSVFKLAEPGSGEDARFLEGVELNRLVYGNILDAYGTGAFGEVERAPEAEAMRAELATLNSKALDAGLSPEERRRREGLRAIFSTED